MAPTDARKTLEQIRRKKNKNSSNNTNKNKSGASTNKSRNVKDLRQLISKKKPRTSDGTPNKVARGRITKTRSSTSDGNSRDLRDSNRKLASRRHLSQDRSRGTSDRNRSASDSQGTSSRISSINKKSSANGASTSLRPVKLQRQYYIPPHMQAPATYIISPPMAQAPQSNLAMDSVPEAQGASVLISNLMPTINQSEIIELFGDIGVMTAVNMINQTTALVTYQSSSDAVRAVKVYHNRLLDGKPMFVNMMPNSTPASSVRSRVGHAPVMGTHHTSADGGTYTSQRVNPFRVI